MVALTEAKPCSSISSMLTFWATLCLTFLRWIPLKDEVYGDVFFRRNRRETEESIIQSLEKPLRIQGISTE